MMCSVPPGQWKKSHAPEPALLLLDDQQALAGDDEEALLRVLAVIHPHRLARCEDADVETELREPPLAFEVADRSRAAPRSASATHGR